MGQYRREATSPFVSRTGFVALDVDAYKDADALDATAIRDAIAATPYCAAAFISASGKGVKALIRVEPCATDALRAPARVGTRRGCGCSMS